MQREVRLLRETMCSSVANATDSAQPGFSSGDPGNTDLGPEIH